MSAKEGEGKETHGRTHYNQRVREKQIMTYEGPSIRGAADFSSETLKARRQWPLCPKH